MACASWGPRIREGFMSHAIPTSGRLGEGLKQQRQASVSGKEEVVLKTTTTLCEMIVNTRRQL